MHRSFIVLISLVAMACSTSEPVRESTLETLIGTAWTVVSVDGAAVAPGSTLTANFGENGELTGNAGCNQYLATYEVEESSLRIHLTGASKKLCSEPEGVMAQEALFLGLFGSVSTFGSSGPVLTLSKEDGAAVVTLQISE